MLEDREPDIEKYDIEDILEELTNRPDESNVKHCIYIPNQGWTFILENDKILQFERETDV